MSKMTYFITLVCLFMGSIVFSQDYYFENYKPFNKDIPSPDAYFGYFIGDSYTRHDQVVAYMETLASLSERASLEVYGESIEGRELVILTITSKENHKNLEKLKKKHLQVVDETVDITDFSGLPIFINLGYNVHGNEPSGTEAALLAAYTLVASENPLIENYLKESVVFLEPTINPDGRDRYANWANSYKGNPLIADKYDIQHNEQWPYGRTNHYWFDLNRDLLLAVQPESQARLKWFHQWYPNVVTDFHEMGTNSTYFFEPKQHSASLNLITPIENTNVLNEAFAKDYVADLNEIGSLYFTKEKYDATYPGYGSTYGDLQGSLSLLFEQGGSRGHVQETDTGNKTFAFTIRNQYVSTFATIKSAIKNKDLLYAYQNSFFKNAMNLAEKSKVKGYVFGDNYDKNRNKEFVDLLLKHKIEVYPLSKTLAMDGKEFIKGHSFVVPTEQKEYLMVRTMFETHKQYRDSVFYDASSWSMANFYNMKYKPLSKLPELKEKITVERNVVRNTAVGRSEYAYLIPWDDYYAPALLNKLQEKGIIVKTAQEPFSIASNNKEVAFSRGTLLVPVSLQSIDSEHLFQLVSNLSETYSIEAYATSSGYSISGSDLGSSNFAALTRPKTMMLIGAGVSAYEAGEVWHLFEQRMEMPITKISNTMFGKVDLQRYNTMVLVSGSYNSLSKISYDRIEKWVSEGNTLITINTANTWVIKNKIVKERLVEKVKDSIVPRLQYADSRGTIGKQKIGGTIFNIDLDLTHPIAYGYHDKNIPVYKNKEVFLAPSKNRFSTVAKYTEQPHIDGFVSQENIDNYITQSASILSSRIGKGRVVMFSDNPNFRGAWYGTSKLFMNAVFFGSIIK